MSDSMEENLHRAEALAQTTKAVVDTVHHAIALGKKAQLLQQQAQHALEVAASLAGERSQHMDPLVLGALATELRSAKITGRGVFTKIADALPAEMTMAGQIGMKVRGNRSRWPGRAELVYWLEDADGAVLYVGKSGHLAGRIQGHKDKPWVTVHWRICVDRSESSTLEADLIYQHQPPLNREGRFTRLERTA